MRFRVLWTDADGQGRWTTVEAASFAAAAWDVAIAADSQSATFEDIDRIDANGDAP